MGSCTNRLADGGAGALARDSQVPLFPFVRDQHATGCVAFF